MGMIVKLSDVEQLGRVNMKIALCHGVFDVLHEGHLNYLEEAASQADVLVVSITTDRYVNKGPGRPYFDHNTRARMIAALDVVDYVIINDEPRATNVITALKPKLYVKGPDYKDRGSDLTKGIYEEEEATKKAGGEVIFTNARQFSSSTLINTFFNNKTEDQNKAIEAVKDAGGLPRLVEIFRLVEKLEVTVIGEPIVDTYTFCEPQGLSSKSANISARFISEENYAGGSLAIANHLSDFVRNVRLFAPYGPEMYFQHIKKTMVDKRVNYFENCLAGYTTPRKTRFIDKDKSQRMFELTNITPDVWAKNNVNTLISQVKSAGADSSLALLCDFGHGLFEGKFLSQMYDLGCFTALNCQTNSSNFGFNPYTKHDASGIDYLSIDLKEAQVAFHDKTSPAPSLFNKISLHNCSMTLGGDGALFKNNGETHKVPAFADKVVDTIGAGDAYYAITSLLVKVGAPPVMVPFIGNIFAGLKTKIIGNKHSVTKAQLLKAVDAILK